METRTFRVNKNVVGVGGALAEYMVLKGVQRGSPGSRSHIDLGSQTSAWQIFRGNKKKERIKKK